jgi:hypothetical protein
MPTPSRDKLLRMDGWPGGMNNRVRETEQVVMRDGESIQSSQFLRRALNVDLTAEGHPLRRPGYTLAQAGFAHSAWYSRGLNKFFVVIDGLLYAGDTSATLAPFMAVNRYLRVSYTDHPDGNVYFTNGADTGSYTPGGFVAWPDAAKVSGLPDIPDQTFDDPTGELIAGKHTHHHEILPSGQLIASYKGRIWIARDNYVVFSHASTVHYYRPSAEFFLQPGYVELLQPVEGGMYVGDAENIRFIRGTDPYDTQQIHVYPHGVVKGAFARIPGEKFELPYDEVPVWWCRDGTLCLGMPDGQIRQLTRDRLAVAAFEFGAVSLREREGISQIVSSLQKGGNENNMGATDTVVAEIRRADC